MRSTEMTQEQRDRALERREAAEQLFADLEKQYSFVLPELWRVLATRLLMGGLSDPELHDLFSAAMQAEFEAGRLAERPPVWPLD